MECRYAPTKTEKGPYQIPLFPSFFCLFYSFTFRRQTLIFVMLLELGSYAVGHVSTYNGQNTENSSRLNLRVYLFITYSAAGIKRHRTHLPTCRQPNPIGPTHYFAINLLNPEMQSRSNFLHLN